MQTQSTQPCDSCPRSGQAVSSTPFSTNTLESDRSKQETKEKHPESSLFNQRAGEVGSPLQPCVPVRSPDNNKRLACSLNRPGKQIRCPQADSLEARCNH